MPNLWRHKSRPLVFTLWVSDFEVQYTTKGDVDYILNALINCHYIYTADWKGKQYCGITIRWDYKAQTCTILVLGYIEQILLRFQHQTRAKQQHSPFPAPTIQYGKSAQRLSLEYKTALLTNPEQNESNKSLVRYFGMHE